jgi:REP element-mobilizing transposase RayT
VLRCGHGYQIHCPRRISSLPCCVDSEVSDKVLKGEVKESLEKRLFEIQKYHPEVEIEKFSIQVDHMHLVSVIPPMYSVSSVVSKITANTTRKIRIAFHASRRCAGATSSGHPAFSHRRSASTNRS